MFRWQYVSDTTFFGMTVKMYRNPYEPLEKIIIPSENLELDHVAYKNFKSELYMYKIMDTNTECYLEERGDVSRLKPLYLPIRENKKETIL